MAFSWSSGSRSGVLCSVCAGDLIDVRLTYDSGGPETASRNGYLPHLVYVPRFAGREGGGGTIGGESPPSTLPLEFRCDITALYCPYNGDIRLDGGNASAPTTYQATYTRTKCADRPVREHALTLLDVGIPTPLPRGVYAVAVPTLTSIRFSFGGGTFDLQIAPGEQMEVGVLAQGSIEPVPLAPAIPHVSLRLRI